MNSQICHFIFGYWQFGLDSSKEIQDYKINFIEEIIMIFYT